MADGERRARRRRRESHRDDLHPDEPGFAAHAAEGRDRDGRRMAVSPDLDDARSRMSATVTTRRKVSVRRPTFAASTRGQRRAGKRGGAVAIERGGAVAIETSIMDAYAAEEVFSPPASRHFPGQELRRGCAHGLHDGFHQGRETLPDDQFKSHVGNVLGTLHDAGHRVPSASVTAGLGEYGQWLDYAHDRASQSDRRGMPVRPDTIEMALFDDRTLFVMRVLLASHYQGTTGQPAGL